MVHHDNLQILAFVGNDATILKTTLDYLTGIGYPKVMTGDMVSQIEHLSQAGQHRIITEAVADVGSYEELKKNFPGKIQLIGITSKEHGSPASGQNTELIEHADHYIGIHDGESLTDQLDELIEKLGFTL